ncbi:hypothetical protein [Helicobacter sp. 23-1045]
MKSIIDYEKYANMSHKQLLNSLTSTQKKEQKISEKLKDTRNLIAFLQSKVKIKAKNNANKSQFVAYKDSQSYKIARQRENLRTPKEQNTLAKEVESLINKGYDEL